MQRLVLILALAPFLTPTSLGAQDSGEKVGAWVGPSLLVTEISHQVSTLAGFEAGLTIRGRLRLGGGGHTLIRSVELTRSGTTPLDLSLGYGGVVAQYLIRRRGDWSLGAGALAGGGAARVRDPVSGAELGSDNFVVVEPRIEAALLLRSFVRLSLSVRYRAPMGVDDLPRVGSTQMRGLGAAIGISFGSFDPP